MGGDAQSTEVLKFQYRKLFHLSAQQMADEPVDEFLTNLFIYGLIQKRKLKEMKKAQRKHGTS